MDFDLLQTFLVVASNKSFTKAEDILHLSQSAISKRINRLEEELNVTLIERSTANFKLTKPGDLLLNQGRLLYEDAEMLRLSLLTFQEKVEGKLSIGCYGLFNLRIVSYIRRYFEEQFPSVELTFTLDRIKEIPNDVYLEKHDLYISLGCELEGLGLKKATLIERQLLAVLPLNHPLAQRKSIGIADLVNFPLVFWGKEMIPKFYTSLMREFEKCKISPNIIQCFDRADDIVLSVLSGKGSTILFNFTNVFSGEAVIQIPIIGTDIDIDVDYGYIDNDGKHALQLLIHFIENFNFEILLDADY